MVSGFLLKSIHSVLFLTLTFHDLRFEILGGIEEKNRRVKQVKNTERMLSASI